MMHGLTNLKKEWSYMYIYIYMCIYICIYIYTTTIRFNGVDREIHLYFTCCFNIIPVLAAKPLQLKIVIIKLRPALVDTRHV